MERRCSKCSHTKNLKAGFYRYKRGRGGYQAQCKACMRGYKRTRKSEAKKVLDRQRETGFRVLRCPGGLFRSGAEFSRSDFLESLAGLVWPEGMDVEDIADHKCYTVHGYQLLELVIA